jgi:hypothetical protein
MSLTVTSKDFMGALTVVTCVMPAALVAGNAAAALIIYARRRKTL